MDGYLSAANVVVKIFSDRVKEYPESLIYIEQIGFHSLRIIVEHLLRLSTNQTIF